VDVPSVGNGLSELAGLTGLTGLSAIDRSEMTSLQNQTGSLQRTTVQGTILKFDESNVEGARLNQQTVTTHHNQQVPLAL
jgi:hypothetical protein